MWGCNARNFDELRPLVKIAIIQQLVIGGILRNYAPDQNCSVKVCCIALPWEDFWGITPWPPKLRRLGMQWEEIRSGLQCAAMGCNELQWDEMSWNGRNRWPKNWAYMGVKRYVLGVNLFRAGNIVLELGCQAGYNDVRVRGNFLRGGNLNKYFSYWWTVRN